MSRIGNAPIDIPSGVEIKIDGNNVSVKGKQGELFQEIDPAIKVKVEENQVILSRETEIKDHKAKHGLYRALINNMVVGVSEGFSKKLELVGVGFKATNQGQKLEMALGYSHNTVFMIPNEIKIETQTERGKSPVITLTSHDKQLLGQVCAKIRSLRKIEPYKGKGIRFEGEYIRRKAGKSASK